MIRALLLAAALGAQAPVAPAQPQEPQALPPVPDPDPDLRAPLPPLDAEPDRPSAEASPPPEPPARYTVVLEGLDHRGIVAAWRAASALWQGRREAVATIDLSSRIRADEKLLQALLAQEGWFAARVATQVTPGPEETVVTLRVEPGRRFTWEEVAIEVFPEDEPAVLADFGLMPGAPIRLPDVEEAEAAYRLRLAAAGFPFAELGPRDIVIDREAGTGSYLLTGLLGPRAVFGRIRLEGHRPFSERHAQVIARFRPGEPWREALVDDFRRALAMTRLIANLAVRPQASGATDAQGRAITDVVVTGEPAPRRSLEALAGYSTEEGVRVEGRWQSRNLWRPEGTFTVRAVVGTLEQRLDADLRQANFGRRDRFLALGTYFSNLDQPAFRARGFGLSAAIGRQSTPIWQKRWTWQTGLEVLQSREQDKVAATGQLGPREAFTIFAAPTTGGLDLTDDLLDPGRGARAGLKVSPEGAFANGDLVAYVRLQGDASAYWRAATRLVVAARVRLGSIVGTQTANVAPSRRLYAGGGGSIRGYGFQSVGPQAPGAKAEAVPVGGRGLFETGVELRYRIGDFGLVGFLDAGQAVDRPRPSLVGLRAGGGLGVRYYSPIGPLRLDVARAIDRRPQDPRLVLYISIGQAF
ncbi:MAG: BamA/TamA family outer membrane protein [Sphingomonadaceae bacterium]|uniref:autotransporter assembly complex protein TamA n=1 Tax=Thermaurantiacus sp. TaxID=2820283 RepID=UPI00298ED543|nr:BamA/TamA family outer membrane protein [Thermaurantiacus sp.]MCS6987188.1 BamA/TamA family outer membrane protein [Sphingomonadaceae bacterium]MDW8415778.1 BamA/TamA family outer membrane protein [Thermaurantiacus sp.]